MMIIDCKSSRCEWACHGFLALSVHVVGIYLFYNL